MNWNKVTFNKRIALGFGIVLVLLVIVGVQSYSGVEGIVKNAAQALEKNNLDDILASAERTKRNITIVVILAIVAGTALAIFIARGIITVLQRTSENLSESAEQVASASSQVANSSHSLAEGASEQAASIEETSSSLEEMSSMTKQNADNASQADNLMKTTNDVVHQSNISMDELTVSMNEISRASEETFKIIKTIDEIAFQTNLLALNAAVEAARAGEAGAGFAVVADEVRNLALRAADAAKNTAALIEGTVKKIKDGSDLVNKTNEDFGKVAESSSMVGALVAEIAAASNEQASGVDQVNKAVTEMDKIVQQNAANSEESASAAEEMNAQAEQMKDLIKELLAISGGRIKKEVPSRSMNRSSNTIGDPSIYQTAPVRNLGLIEQPSTQQRVQPKAYNPEQVIPFDEDEDFKDF